MRTTHLCSWQTLRCVTLGLSLTACATQQDEDTIWPPSDFEFSVEEVTLRPDEVSTRIRFRARADGTVCFGAATDRVVDPATGVELPVFGCLSVYELVPTCTRALARRVYRAGVLDLDVEETEQSGETEIGTVLRLRAFGRRTAVPRSARCCAGVRSAVAPP
ncbi:MAG: hypothetical protein KDC98_03365, partial [Planctomycetes bacterium]|nr:hypothetical protein [Planctomycetota bacterium]